MSALCQKQTFNHVVEKLSELFCEVWPEAERKLWFQLLEGSFKLIY